MNLLVLAEDFYPNTSGGAHVRWEFCRQAAQRGHDVTVVTPRRDETPPTEEVDGVKIHRPFGAQPDSLPAYVPLAFLFRLLFSIRLLIFLIREHDLSTVTGVHSASNTLHWVGRVVSTYAGVTHVSFVGYTPSLASGSTNPVKILLERLTFRFGFGGPTFCRSPETKVLIEELSDTNVELVHGILDQSAIYETFEACSPVSVREEFGVTSDDTLLVFVGRLTPTKNPGGAIDIMSTLPKEYQLVVVGDGEQRRALERIVHGSSLEEQVQFTGVLNHQEALSIIASADGLLVTSHVESYSAVTLEALALGTPVFGTSVGVLQYMDHERLYTGEMDDIPGIIKNSNFTGEFSIDKEIVEQYGMSTYTETILNGFQQSDPA